MSAQRIQANRALKIIPSDYCGIPYPAPIYTGSTSASVGPTVLYDVNGNFITRNVRIGDIVYNFTDNTAATVTVVTSEQSLTLNGTIIYSLGANYTIYQASEQTTIGNYGCVLYVGTAGDVNLTTTGSDSVILSNVNAGQFIPVQTLGVRLSGTTASNIVALW